MTTSNATIIGGIYGVEPPLPLDDHAPTNLPGGAVGFAIEPHPGTRELLLLLPPGMEIRLAHGETTDTAVQLIAGARFVLADAAGSQPELWFKSCALVATAGELRVGRCDLCHEPFSPATPVRRCAGCGRVLCEALCSTRGTCPRCGDSLSGWEEAR